MGDFNYDYNCNDDIFKSKSRYLEYLFNFTQLIVDTTTRQTEFSATCIDLIYIFKSLTFSVSGVLEVSLSDHFAVFTVLSCSKQPKQKRTVKL